MDDRPFTLEEFRTLQTKLAKRQGGLQPEEYTSVLTRLKKYPLVLPEEDFAALVRKRSSGGSKLPPHEYIPYLTTRRNRIEKEYERAKEDNLRRMQEEEAKLKEKESRKREAEYPPLPKPSAKPPVVHRRRERTIVTRDITAEILGFDKLQSVASINPRFYLQVHQKIDL